MNFHFNHLAIRPVIYKLWEILKKVFPEIVELKMAQTGTRKVYLIRLMSDHRCWEHRV